MNTEALDEEARWFAVRTKPKQENRADANLQSWQVQTFAPKIKEHRSSGYGAKYVIKPLFTRYIFAHFTVSRLHEVNYTRGVQNVVTFGNTPVSIDDSVIDLMRAHIDEDGFICMDQELKPGDAVRVNSGPLKNFVGIFNRNVKNTDRVKILLNTLKYQGHLLIERDLIEKVNSATPLHPGH